MVSARWVWTMAVTSTSGAVTAIAPEVIANQVKVRLRFTGEVPENLRQNQRLTARIQNNRVSVGSNASSIDVSGSRRCSACGIGVQLATSERIAVGVKKLLFSGRGKYCGH